MFENVHFLGIGGSGASAAAAIAQAQGFKVTGCDKEPHNEFTKVFDKDQIFTNHDPKHLACNPRGCNVDILAVTPAIFSLDPKNPELLEAKKMSIPILTWQKFTGEYLTKDKFVIAVCGTHGKTTTTAMIAKILEDAGLDPTILLGAINPKWGSNYRVGKGKYFIVEADEFNDNFLAFKPEITVVTNIEMDHPEYFKDINAYMNSFEKFFLQTKQTIIGNLKDINVAEIIKDVMKESRVTALDFNKIEVEFDLKIPGAHNILNAKAAFQTGLLLGLKPSVIIQSLNSYTGVSRRFEYLGKYKSAEVYSDFGHHPTEIEKTMIAAREKFPNRTIKLIYQPHMFSRTKALFDDFVKVFRKVSDPDLIGIEGTVILDIYPSREVDTGLISSEELVKAINKNNVYYSKWENVKNGLAKYTKPGDILFFMGAGDIDKMAKELIKK